MRHSLFIIIIVVCAAQTVRGHSLPGDETPLKDWCVGGESFRASFLFFNNDSVFLETENHAILGIPKGNFHGDDIVFVNNKINSIQQLNKPIDAQSAGKAPRNSAAYILLAILVITFVLSIGIFFQRRKITYCIPIIILGVGILHLSFTDPNLVRNAFLPFAPNVNTFWDDNYFYVESKGIPTSHEMMVGISNHGWQQQVPIPQCYIGNNAWSIPLNPVMSADPIPVDPTHFTRGAIAIAANGVPIFNPYTNTGVDAYLDGQLDHFGGHCGRGDDYHYHTAPLHLYGQTSSTLPIAYAFDGFAVYGEVEPDGNSMMPLDSNHGHYYNGEYHYHGTNNAPYMVARFAGVVTEDNTHQLIPQAHANPVRTEDWTPLNGALITACMPNGNGNGYDLSYTLNGTTGYATNYSWNSNLYSFDYLTPSGINTIVYNGFIQCDIPISIQEHFTLDEQVVYPNPFRDKVHTLFPAGKQNYALLDAQGKIVFSGTDIESEDFSALTAGTYYLQIHDSTVRLIKR